MSTSGKGILFSFNLHAWCPVTVTLPFARECEDIWGLPNSLQNSPRGNLYVSEHAQSKYGKCAYKYQTRALRKSESVLRLRMWLSRKTAAQRSSLTFRTLAIRTEYQSVVDNNGDDDDRDDDGSASSVAQVICYRYGSERGHEAMEARTSSPRRLQIVAQKKKERKAKEEEWEQPKGNPAAQFSGY